MPAATAAPDPALEPPEVSARSHGLRTVSATGLWLAPAVAELGHRGLAEDDRSGGAEALDEDVVLVRHEVAVGGRPAGHRHPGDRDEVLDPDRDAAERAGLRAGGERALELPGGLQGIRVRAVAERVQTRLEAVHPAMDRLDHLDRRDLAAADRRREIDRREQAGVRSAHSARAGLGTAATAARLCAATASIAR
jgi:hypothetical protein